MSAPKMMTRKGKKEEEDAVTFEKMFYDRGTQRAALEDFQERLKSLTKKDRMELRNSPKSSGKVEGPGKAKKLKVQTKEDEETPEDFKVNGLQVEDPTGKEKGWVRDLLKLYDNGIKNSMPKKEEGGSQSDSDDDILDAEIRASMDETGSNDFVKHSVPQYELKEKLWQMHYDAIKTLTMKEIVDLLTEVLPELNQIRRGEILCERHTIFESSGLSKQKLRDMAVSEPFTTYQDSRIMEVIQANIYGDKDLTKNNGQSLHYISNVLLQEALVRIFAKANKIDNKLAENELRFKAGYGGKLSPDVIKTIPEGGEQID